MVAKITGLENLSLAIPLCRIARKFCAYENPNFKYLYCIAERIITASETSITQDYFSSFCQIIQLNSGNAKCELKRVE